MSHVALVQYSHKPATSSVPCKCFTLFCPQAVRSTNVGSLAFGYKKKGLNVCSLTHLYCHHQLDFLVYILLFTNLFLFHFILFSFCQFSTGLRFLAPEGISLVFAFAFAVAQKLDYPIRRTTLFLKFAIAHLRTKASSPINSYAIALLNASR